MPNQQENDRDQRKPIGDKQKTTSQPGRKPGQGSKGQDDRKK